MRSTDDTMGEDLLAVLMFEGLDRTDVEWKALHAIAATAREFVAQPDDLGLERLRVVLRDYVA